MEKRLTLLVVGCYLLSFQTGFSQWTRLDENIAATFQNNGIAYNGKVYFAGGPQNQNVTTAPYSNKVYQLDLETHDISLVQPGLSIGRAGMMCAAISGKLYFAGGFKWTANSPGMVTFKIVDIYDIANDEWTVQELSVGRGLGAVAIVNGKIMFAGGYAISGGQVVPSDIIEIYNPSDSSWTIEHLSQARAELDAGVVGNQAWFCGGSTSWTSWQSSDRVDIFDVDSASWYTDTLSLARSYPTVAVAYPYLLCAGGYTPTAGYSDRVDKFNLLTGEHDVEALSLPRFGMAAATLGNKAYFTGGGHIDLSISYFDASSSRVDVFDAVENEWSISNMNDNRMTHSCAAWGNKIVVGGGWNAEQMKTIGTVEVLTDSLISVVDSPTEKLSIRIFPNPTPGEITIELPDGFSAIGTSNMTIFDLTGRACFEAKIRGNSERFDIGALPPGMYWVEVRSGQVRYVDKLIVGW